MCSIDVDTFGFYEGVNTMKKFTLVGTIIFVIILGLFTIFSLKKDVKDIPPSQGKPVNTEQPQVKEKEVRLYYANKKYIDSGNETLPKVISITKKINYDKISLPEAAIRELGKEPKDVNLDTEVPEQALLGVEVKDGEAIVNFSGEKLSGGSLEEMLTIEQIVRTLLDIKGINSVQFYKDGKPTESLMEHVDTSEPFYKTKEIKASELQIGEIRLSMKKDEFIQKYGEPTSTSIEKSSNSERLIYNDFTVAITNGVISEIDVTSEKYATPSGIKVGYNKKQVMNSYGEPSSVYRGTLNYKVGGENERLHIKIKDGKVTEIKVNL